MTKCWQIRWGLLAIAMVVVMAWTGSAFALVKDPNARLRYAASTGDVEGAKAALADGADANYFSHPFKDASGMSVLHTAAHSDHPDVIALLVKHGANINITDKNGETPLGLAVFWNKRSAVEMLLAKGADPNRAENNQSIMAGYTPLHLAARDGHRDLVSLLLDHGAKPNLLAQEDATPLDLAGDAATAALLQAHGGQIGGYAEDGETLLSAADRELFTAILVGDERRVRTAIGRGAHVNFRNSLHRTPLIQAVAMGRADIVLALVQSGADVNETDNYVANDTPLHWAAARGLRDIVEILLQNGANPNTKGYLQQAPVDLAKDADTAGLLFKFGASAADSSKAFCGLGAIEDAQRAELFLTHGFDANSRTGWCSDSTPLYHASLFNRWAVATALLNHGADPNIADKSDSTPLSVAAENGGTELVTQLLAKSAKIDVLDKDGNTPLIRAARYGRTEVVKVLLDHKADPKIKGKDGITALSASKNIEIVDLLLSHGANVDDLLTVWFGKDTAPTDKQIALFRTVVAGGDAAVAGLSPDDVTSRDPSTNGQMAVNLAIAFGREKALDWLLEHGADANAADKDGFTPMHRVLTSLTLDSQRQIQMMRSLLAHGARIDPVGKEGWTPLLIAAGTFNRPVTEFLLSHSADPLLRSADGYTPLQLARRSSHGTSPMGLMIPEDVNQKAATIDAINRVLLSHPQGEVIQAVPLASPAVVAKPTVSKVSPKPPTISTTRSLRTATVTVDVAGKVTGAGKLVAFKVDDSDAPIASDGAFAFRRAVPIGDSDIKLVATNEWGLTADVIVKVTRAAPVAAAPIFPPLDPARAKGKPRLKAIALIIVIERYESAPPAEFAESDARSFYDYATNALGIPRDRIKLLTGGDARRLDVRKALLNWAKPLVARGQTEVFVFFAGHGLATPDGKELYLLPFDGDRTLLTDSSIRRKEIIDTFTDAGASSTTLFIDACYAGGTRTSETLVPSARPILVTAKDEPVPANVIVFAAAANDQFSSSLAPVKHGLFSYFLMRGLEGDAAGPGHTITAAGLEAYLTDHIPSEAAKLGRTQTPQLIGDGSRVLSAW